MERNDLEDEFSLGVQRIIAARDLKPATLSLSAGLGQTAVRDLFRKASSPKVSTAQALAAALGLSIDQIIAVGRGASADFQPLPAAQAHLVQVMNVSASAGYGEIVDSEYIVDRMAFPPGYLASITKAGPESLSIISVHGDSMVPTLYNNDLVMIDRSKRDLSFDGLFVIRDDGVGLLIKRVGRASQRGFVMLIPDNKSYPTVERSRDEIEVIGRVIWVGKKV